MSENKSEVVEKLNLIQNNVHKNLLKKIGFKKRGRTWNRTTSDGLIQAINFQLFQFHPGKFCVNVGIVIPEIVELYFNIETRGFMQEYICQIRTRLTPVMDSNKVGWNLHGNVDKLSSEIEDTIKNHAIPFLKNLENKDLVIKTLSKQSTLFLNPPLPKLQLALIFYTKGDLKRAKKLLKEAYNSSKHKSHKENLVKLAEKLNVADFLK
jgi:hypothetical protein